MRRVITASEVEAAAVSGERIVLTSDTIVTPLARDRARALGVAIAASPGGPQPASKPDSNHLVLESRVRMVARRVLLRSGRSLDQLEQVVGSVLQGLDHECDCGCKG